MKKHLTPIFLPAALTVSAQTIHHGLPHGPQDGIGTSKLFIRTLHFDKDGWILTDTL